MAARVRECRPPMRRQAGNGRCAVMAHGLAKDRRTWVPWAGPSGPAHLATPPVGPAPLARPQWFWSVGDAMCARVQAAHAGRSAVGVALSAHRRPAWVPPAAPLGPVPLVPVRWPQWAGAGREANMTSSVNDFVPVFSGTPWPHVCGSACRQIGGARCAIQRRMNWAQVRPNEEHRLVCQGTGASAKSSGP